MDGEGFWPTTNDRRPTYTAPSSGYIRQPRDQQTSPSASLPPQPRGSPSPTPAASDLPADESPPPAASGRRSPAACGMAWSPPPAGAAFRAVRSPRRPANTPDAPPPRTRLRETTLP